MMCGEEITTVKYLKLASKVRWMRAEISKLRKSLKKQRKLKMEEQEKENSNAEEGDSVLEESLKEEECKISAKDRNLLFTEGVKELVNDKKHIIDWRIGWNFLPRNIDDVIDMMESLSIAFHADWLAAMEMGEAPSEDVSPGETFMLCRQIIRNMKKKLEKYEPTENNKNEDEESK